MKFRNEWKYICHSNDLLLIENKLSKVLKLDEHTNETNKYLIHSLYFDDINNTCMFENDAGLGNRFKYRIRYYNDDINHLTLEKKIKVNGLCKKLSCPISLDDYYSIINNNISEVFWNNDNELLKKFCIDIQTKMFRPRVIIDYERTAYVEPITNIRITLDRNISGSIEIDRFIDGDYLKYPLQDKDKHLLEVKFDDVLPNYIKQSCEITKLNQATFSKYYLSRKVVEGNLMYD